MWLLQGHQAWQLWVTNQEAARDHRLQLSSTFRPRPPLNTLEIVHLRTPPTILTAGTDKPVEQEVTLLSITRQFTLNPQEIPWIPSLPIRIPKTWRMNRWRSSLQQNFGKSLTDRLTLSICTRPYRFIFLTPCVVLLSFTQTVVLKLEWQKCIDILDLSSILWKGPATKGRFSVVSQCTGFARGLFWGRIPSAEGASR